MKFVNQSFVYVNTNFSSKEELIDQIGEQLVHEKFVAREFVETVQEREELGGTDLPSGTAVPHGNSTYVNETIIVVVRNKKSLNGISTM